MLVKRGMHAIEQEQYNVCCWHWFANVAQNVFVCNKIVFFFGLKILFVLIVHVDSLLCYFYVFCNVTFFEEEAFNIHVFIWFTNYSQIALHTILCRRSQIGVFFISKLKHKR